MHEKNLGDRRDKFEVDTGVICDHDRPRETTSESRMLALLLFLIATFVQEKYRYKQDKKKVPQIGSINQAFFELFVNMLAG